MDGRRRQWIKWDVFFNSSTVGVPMRERFGICGWTVFRSFVSACKKSGVPGQISYSNDHEALSIMSLPGLRLANEQGDEWVLDDLWAFLGQRHQVRKRVRGGITTVISRRWDEWQTTPGRVSDDDSTTPTPRQDETQTRRSKPKNTNGKESVITPEKEREKEKENESEKDTAFDSFWKAYPRKVAKPAARRAWHSALKRTPAHEMTVGAERYAADPNRVERFTKHPATWLNNECWNDPPLPSQTGLSVVRNGNGESAKAALARRVFGSAS